jgi:cholesterol oxidase
VFTGTRVSHVEREEDGWRVHFSETTAAGDGGDAATGEVKARFVVLAAGTLGSTGILLRSRERGLPLSDRLGEGFSANGDIIAFGYGADRPVNAVGVGHPPKFEEDTVGPCVAGQIKLGDEETLANEMYVQEGVMPSGLAPLLPVAFTPGGRLIGAAQSIIEGVYKGPFANLHTFFVVSHDEARGRIVLEDGAAVIDWPDVAEQEVYRRVDAVLEKAVTANGARYVKNPLADTVLGEQPATAHPLGGCGMGGDASDGVIDHKCRVFDASAGTGTTAVHDGLYVCDGAVMPRSLGVNPLLTITALAERAMIHMARDHEWRFDDAPLKG